MKEIYLAGGSFRGLQKYLNLIFGILKTEVGYVNGKTKTTNYSDIKKTDHAEAVKVLYNDKVLPLEKLLEYFYDVINPTSVNKQGKAVGREYRSGIYYTDKRDVPIIIKSLEKLQKQNPRKIVVEVENLKNYIKAENYHQDFLKNNPFGYSNISLKQIEELKAKQYENLSYRVMKYRQTEEAYNNEYYNNYNPGIYVDKETNRPLFMSIDKYNRGYGWPTFYKTTFPNEIENRIEIKNLKVVNEIISKAGRNHLGYLFYDGPSGKRYMVNSSALTFIPQEKMEKEGFGAYLKYLK